MHAMDTKEMATYALLDFEGAFNSTTYEEIPNALIRKEVENTVAFWTGKIWGTRLIAVITNKFVMIKPKVVH